MKTIHPCLHNASRHNDGRPFGRYHNDRQGETNSEYCHVDSTLSDNNIYYNIIDDEWYTHADARKGSYMSFKDAEDTFLKETLKDAYEAQMQRYREHRQYKRIKSLDDWYEDCRKQGSITVEQQYLQLGNYDDGSVTKEQLFEIVVDYLKDTDEYNEVHNVNCVILDIAIHVDEVVNGIVTAHAHINRVYLYEKDGIVASRQEECLRQSDLTLPDASKKSSRYNNLKMTFTADYREILCNVCERHGLDISRDAIPTGNKKHCELDAYITKQNRKKLQETKEAEARAREAEEEAAEERQKAQEAIAERDAMRLQMIEMQRQIEALQSVSDAIDEENKKKLNDSERACFEFGRKMAKEHGAEWQQFLDDKFDTPATPPTPGDEFSL